jgi:hypothetical protein
VCPRALTLWTAVGWHDAAGGIACWNYAEDTMSASHGNTPAAWTAVSIMFVGFLIAGLALPFSLPWLFFVGLAVVVIGAVVGKAMQMMGMGTITYKNDHEQHDPDHI